MPKAYDQTPTIYERIAARFALLGFKLEQGMSSGDWYYWHYERPARAERMGHKSYGTALAAMEAALAEHEIEVNHEL